MSFEWGPVEPFYQSALTDGERLLRKEFVKQYMHDRNPYAAALRCGFMACFANEYSRRFMEEGYVLQLIQDAEQNTGDKKKEREANERAVEANLLQIAKDGTMSSASRVAACAKLSVIYGMDAPLKTQHDINHRGGVMMVPAIADVDDWEKAAMTSQELLAKNARN